MKLKTKKMSKTTDHKQNSEAVHAQPFYYGDFKNSIEEGLHSFCENANIKLIF